MRFPSWPGSSEADLQPATIPSGRRDEPDVF
jgi:hypothetical protein